MFNTRVSSVCLCWARLKQPLQADSALPSEIRAFEEGFARWWGAFKEPAKDRSAAPSSVQVSFLLCAGQPGNPSVSQMGAGSWGIKSGYLFNELMPAHNTSCGMWIDRGVWCFGLTEWVMCVGGTGRGRSSLQEVFSELSTSVYPPEQTRPQLLCFLCLWGLVCINPTLCTFITS